MGEVIWGHDFTARKNAERLEVERNSHEVLQVAFEGGPKIEIPMSEVDAHFATEYGGRNSSMGGPCIEPPADCPA